MQQRSSVRRRALRALTYIVSIGGLMVLFAGLLWIGWNTFFSHRFAFGSLSLLESIGLVSIAYIVHSSIRFAGGDECVTDSMESPRYDVIHHHTGMNANAVSAATARPSSPEISSLNNEQKEDLKKSIEGIYLKTDRDLEV